MARDGRETSIVEFVIGGMESELHGVKGGDVGTAVGVGYEDKGDPIIATLTGHSHSVWCLSKLEWSGNLFHVSGSFDRSIKIWDLQKINVAAALMGHSDWVHCVVTYRSNGKPYLMSGSDDVTKLSKYGI